MALADRIYGSSPTWLQHAMVSAYGWRWRRLRLGGRWAEFARGFREREGWSRERWRDFTADRLRGLLSTARESVPYYRREWQSLGITPSRLSRIEPEELSTLPMLTKDVARLSPTGLLVGGVAPRGANVFHTSGSTGTPIATYWTAEEMQRSVALRETRSAGWAGVSYLEPRATFSGRLVVPDPTSPGPYHRFNIFERQVYFSAFHLGPSTAERYVAALRRHRPQWQTGYAYSWYTLARLGLEQGLECPAPRAVVTTSEKVTTEMRTVMQRFYRCKVYEEYGTVEDVAYASECEKGRLHVSPDAGIIEIVDRDGQPVSKGQPGQVVATGFIRDCQVFIRFALGDEAIWSDEGCPCGREMPVLREVIGRIEDAVVGLDGREMVRFHGIFVDQPNIVEGQIVQEAIDHIRALVVPTPGFGSRDVAEVERRIHARLTSRVNVTVETVDAIPRAKSGKYKAVVSHVTRNGS